MIASAIIDVLSLTWRWFPWQFEILDTTHHGLRWWKGEPTEALTEPGLYWYMTWFGDITDHSILPQVVESEVQLVGLACGTTLGISVAIHYRVTDVMKWYHAVEEFDDSFTNLVQMSVTETIATYTFTQWLDEDVMSDLRKRFKTLARRWGVEVIDLNFVNSGRVRPLHITGISIGETE